MDIYPAVEVAAPPEQVFDVIEDLATYPHWLDIVSDVALDTTPSDDSSALSPSWFVTLVGSIGPLRRSKRLRMTRVNAIRPTSVRFERREQDGRQHSEWSVDVSINAHSEVSAIAMHLHYGGSLWVPVLERLLNDEVEASRDRLGSFVGGR